MALISTPAATNADSFASMEELDSILSGHLYSSPWFDASNASKKEPAAKTATRILNSIRYVGVPSTSTQSLQFPMEGLTRYGGLPVPTTDESDSYINPPEIKLAQAEYSRILISSTSDITVESDVSVQGISKIKAGAVEIGFHKQDSSTSTQYTESCNPALSSIPRSVRDLIPSSWLYPETEPLSVLVESF